METQSNKLSIMCVFFDGTCLLCSKEEGIKYADAMLLMHVKGDSGIHSSSGYRCCL